MHAFSTSNTRTLALGLTAATILTGCQSAQQPTATADETTTQAPIIATTVSHRTAILWVKGLSCPFCETNVDKQLTSLTGVEEVDIDLSLGKVSVLLESHDPSTRQELIAAIDDSGFTLDRIEMPK